MKQILQRATAIAFFAALCNLTCNAATNKTDSLSKPIDGAHIVFEKQTIDFGSFKKDSVQEGRFIFTNDGNKPLVLQQVFSECGCTVPIYSSKPIMPGEKGEITVTFNGKNRLPGLFKKIIRVRSNAVNYIERIFITGKIKRE